MPDSTAGKYVSVLRNVLSWAGYGSDAVGNVCGHRKAAQRPARRRTRLSDAARGEHGDPQTGGVRELQSLEAGRVRIGANESAGNYLLPRLIQTFRLKHPKVRVDVTRQNSRQLINDIRDNMVDLALISFVPEEKDIEATAVMKDELALVVYPGHAFAKKDGVGIRELGGEAFIAHTVTSPSRQKVVEAFRSTDTPLKIVMEVAMIETIKKLIAMKLGIAFVPEMSVQDEIQRGELIRVRVDGFQYERTLWLARRRAGAHSNAARAFAETVLAAQKKNED
jgi:DNA-binding transcriptional LysR family regulator